MSNINIAGTTPVDDPEYRYKMPRLIAKIEGRGNGIKTVVVNAVELAMALHRTPGEVTKFFGTELGAQSKYDDKTERAVVNGAFDQSAMQAQLSKFIELFVLCPNCRLPETKYKFKGKDAIFHKCLACGAVEPVDMNHKLTTYLIKEHTAAKRAAKSGDSKKDKKEKKSKDKSADADADDEPKKEKKDKKSKDGKEKKEKKDKDGKKSKKSKKAETDSDDETAPKADVDSDDEIEWHTDLSAEAVAARAREAEAIEAAAHAAMAANAAEQAAADLAAAAALENLNVDDDGAIESAVESLTAFLSSPRSDAAILDEVVKQQTNAALLVGDRLAIFFGAAFTAQILAVNEIAKYARVLEKLVDSERLQFQLIALTEHFCAVKVPALLHSFPVLLKLLYDEDVLAEDTILSWSVDETRKNYAHYEVTDAHAIALKKALTPFIDWLENAEEEESDDDDE